ncbi:4-(cytidine 5'-diphospho)-2-C-methyl-D-erythritol kinase [Hymenobacter qilianensis]|uniref:4-(cytidine 5'-diphospho)-2-C-methyl-D-erythritol kinase n=1 Tax=Hymenobacter qilianensis TaxID=1385715 RepID=UPI00293BF212|nr:hypothetical protein [Hymenobacter qilianensis]
MLVFPNAKLNLGLYITGLRPDGFRDLESVFVPLPWSDALEVLPAESDSLALTGIPIPGEPHTNLCWRAYELLRADFNLSPVQMHLHKIVPIGAGLGGGSADAAFALRALNELFELKMPPQSWKITPGASAATVLSSFKTNPYLPTKKATYSRR